MVNDFDFQQASTSATRDQRLKAVVSNSTTRRDIARRESLEELPDSDRLRELAGRIKQHTLDHLDYYLEQVITSVTRNGGHVHLVSTPQQARDLVIDLAKKAGCTRIIKSKSMVSEEIELTHELERQSLDVVESDLGEFIVQITHDKPSHLIAPILHKDKASVAKVFSEYFKTPYNDDAEFLTRQARAFLRDKFRHAEMGMTGANFVVAQSGHVCVVENEGNARQSITTPRLLVTLTGIEKIVPRLSDLAVMLKLLTRSATGNRITVYTSLFGGPRHSGERDGPQEFHLILLDSGRSEILAGKYRQTLSCIRCGACLNACPVYRKIGGHAYGHVYSGPIGALITPLLNGLDQHTDLPQASSLCGACFDACPVKIDIPRHLVNLRHDIVQRQLNGRLERMTYRLWAWGMKSPFLYRLIGRIQKWDLRRRAGSGGWISRLPKIASGWTQVRDMPPPAQQSFHQLWKKR